MSLSTSHDQAATAISDATQSELKTVLTERAIAIGFVIIVSTAMAGWLYMLAVAVWDGASWLMS
jgi:hypothetical protein